MNTWVQVNKYINTKLCIQSLPEKSQAKHLYNNHMPYLLLIFQKSQCFSFTKKKKKLKLFEMSVILKVNYNEKQMIVQLESKEYTRLHTISFLYDKDLGLGMKLPFY